MVIASFFGQVISLVLGTIIALKIVAVLLETTISRQTYLYGCLGALTGSFVFRLLNLYLEKVEIASDLSLSNIFSICFFLGLLTIGFFRLFHYLRIKNQSGKVVETLRCAHSSMRLYRLLLVISCIFFISFTLLLITLLLTNLYSLDIQGAPISLLLDVMLLSFIFLLGIINFRICISGRLEVREHALLYLDNAIRWDKIDSYEWKKTDKAVSDFVFLILHLRKNRFWLTPKTILIEVFSSQKSTIETALKTTSIVKKS